MLDDIYNRILRDLAREIRRLKKAGIIPKKAPRLGQYLAIDATDIPAWAKYRSPHCNAPDKENCTERHKKNTANNSDRTKCSTHSSKPIADPSAMRGLPYTQRKVWDQYGERWRGRQGMVLRLQSSRDCRRRLRNTPPHHPPPGQRE